MFEEIETPMVAYQGGGVEQGEDGAVLEGRDPLPPSPGPDNHTPIHNSHKHINTTCIYNKQTHIHICNMHTSTCKHAYTHTNIHMHTHIHNIHTHKYTHAYTIYTTRIHTHTDNIHNMHTQI